MAFEKQYDVLQAATDSPCIHLRSKAIYVTGELTATHTDEEGGADYCWCNLTQHVLGPDARDVHQRECVPGRACFRPTT